MMKSSQFATHFVVAFTAIFLSVNVDDLRADQDLLVARQTRWDYKIEHLHFNSGLEAKLNQLGSQGWELVQIADGTGVFKRMQVPKHVTRTGVQMELAEDPNIIIIRGKKEEVEKAADAIRRIEERRPKLPPAVKDDASSGTGQPVLRKTTNSSREFAKYETMEKKELQAELRRLQEEVLRAEGAGKQAKDKAAVAARAYQAASGEAKADALLAMIETDVASREPVERYAQIRRSFEAAQRAYSALLHSEVKAPIRGEPHSEAIERGMQVDALERQNRLQDGIELKPRD